MKNARMGSGKPEKGICKRCEQKNADTKKVEVLYQKMGDRWFVFSLIDGEVFVGSISQSHLPLSQSTKISFNKITGNS
jgi:hypothetical protein